MSSVAEEIKTRMPRPLGDRVIVYVESPEETIINGVVLPQSAVEKPLKGKVLAVGNGRVDTHGVRVPIDVKVGQTVLFNKFSGNEIDLDTCKALLLSETELQAVFEED